MQRMPVHLLLFSSDAPDSLLRAEAGSLVYCGIAFSLLEEKFQGNRIEFIFLLFSPFPLPFPNKDYPHQQAQIFPSRNLFISERVTLADPDAFFLQIVSEPECQMIRLLTCQIDYKTGSWELLQHHKERQEFTWWQGIIFVHLYEKCIYYNTESDKKLLFSLDLHSRQLQVLIRPKF